MTENRDGEQQTDFKQRSELPVSDDAVIDAGQDRIAVGSGQDLYVIDIEDNQQVTLDRPIDDIAIDRNVYLLQNEVITAITQSGIELWSEAITGATELAATHGEVALLTDTGTVIGLDGASGSERFRHEVAPSDLDTDGIYAAKDRFFASSWTYLSCIDLHGKKLFQRNFDGQIASVGTIGDRAVVAIKNGVLNSVGSDGETDWTVELEVESFSASGSEPLLAVQEANLVELTADGNRTPLVLPPGRSAAATDGMELACIINGDTATVYEPYETAPDPSMLETSAALDFDGRGTFLSITVNNRRERPVAPELSVTVSETGTVLDTVSLLIDPGESTTFEVDIDDDVERTLPIQIRSQNGVVDSHTVSIPERRNPELETATQFEKIVDGTALVTVGVKNNSSNPVRNLVIQPGEERINQLSSGESHVVQLELPFDPGSTVTFGVRSTDSQFTISEHTTQTYPTETPQSNITIANDCEWPFVVVEVEGCPVPITDQVRIQIEPEAVECTRETTVHPETTERIVVYPPHKKTITEASVTAEGLDIESRTVAENTHDQSSKQQSSDTNVTVDRTLDDSASTGTVLTENIYIDNRRDRQETIRVLSCGRSREIVLDPDESASFVRWHEFEKPGKATVPGLTVEQTESESISPSEISVENDPVRLRSHVVDLVDGSAVNAVVENDFDRKLEITGLTVESPKDGGTILREDVLNTVVLPNSSSELGQFPFDTNEQPPYKITVDCERSQSFSTLIFSDQTESYPLDYSIDVSGVNYTKVELTFTNDTDQSIILDTIQARGDILDEFYSAMNEPKELAPGTSNTHSIDIGRHDHSRASIPVSVEIDNGESTQTTEWELSGPLPGGDDTTSVTDEWTFEMQGTKQDSDRDTHSHTMTDLFLK